MKYAADCGRTEMSMKKTKQIIPLLFLTASLLFAACSKGGETGKNTDGSSDRISDSNTETPEYTFYDYDGKNQTVTILNPQPVWNMITTIEPTEQSDKINSALYKRNAYTEDIYKVSIKEDPRFIQDIPTLLSIDVNSGESTWDAFFCSGEYLPALITGGCALNLASVPELQLEKEWWNQSVIKNSTIGNDGSIYFAASDLSLSNFELTWVLIFNRTMLNDLNLDSPFDHVRNGSWTLDRFNEYISAGANLNGDLSFDWNPDGNCCYGFTSYGNFFGAAMAASEVYFTEKNDSGYPEFVADNQKFYDFTDKLASILGEQGHYLDANVSGRNYEQIFKSGRALFVGAELKASSLYRDFKDDFGIVPVPKYSEEQQDYHTCMNYLTLLMGIPSNITDPTRAGIVLDTLSYLSMRDVLPIYYNEVVAQKGLSGDPDSIEMLGIIARSRYFDAGLAYGWTTELYDDIKWRIVKGQGGFAQIVASHIESINQNINDTVSFIDNQ